MFVGANRQFYDNYLLKYRKTEDTPHITKIKHPLLREALKLLRIEPGIEITSLADIAAGTGVGSSGSFLISLLNTLHHYKGEDVSKRQLAEEACKIELEILKEHEGKQDKYVSSFGGIRSYEFTKDGKVKVDSLCNEDIIFDALENNLLLFYTGKGRQGVASDVLKTQDVKCKEDDKDMIEKLDKIKAIGLHSKSVLERGDFDCFGTLLHQHWCWKKQYSPLSTDKFIDDCYDFALRKGALGGKIMGAGGGGGFFIFYYPNFKSNRKEFINHMEGVGLHHMPFKFDNIGVTTITKEEME